MPYHNAHNSVAMAVMYEVWSAVRKCQPPCTTYGDTLYDIMVLPGVFLNLNIEFQI